MKGTVGKLIFFGVGLMAGAAVGILFAPEDGRSTRDKLTFQLGRTRDRLAEIMGQIKEVEDMPVSPAKAASDKRISEIKGEVDRMMESIEQLMDQARGVTSND